MILSFGDKQTEGLWIDEKSKRYGNIARVALRKLLQLHAAEKLSDLSVPPGNQLKALSGKRTGQYSIRINGQWRIGFVWTANGPEKVAICDYH
jgi:proteic killer suppression protein